MKKNWPAIIYSYLPIFILCLSLIFRLFILVFGKTVYWYDEIIVTAISKQPFLQILDTIHAEPHPFGFYFLLHFLPVDNLFLTKIILNFVNFFLFLVALLYAYKNQLVQKYTLSLGLALFFGSYTFLSIAWDAKQDVLSAPILFLGLFAALAIFSKKKCLFDLLLMHACLLLLLCLGYIAYVSVFLFMLITTIILKNRQSILLLVGQVLFAAGYMAIFGFSQVNYNLHRFGWVDNFPNSFLIVFTQHFSGPAVFNFSSDLLAIVILGLLILFPYLKKRMTVFETAMAASIPLLIVLGLASQTIVRDRYVILLMVFISVVAGWSLQFFPKKIQIVIILFVFIQGFVGFILREENAKKAFEVSTVLNSLPSPQSPTGLISNNPPVAFSFFLNGSLAHNIYPFNPIYPENFKKNVVTKDMLLTNVVAQNVTAKEVVNALRASQFREFIYLAPNSPSVYDQENFIGQGLDEVCKKHISSVIVAAFHVEHFSDCF